MPTSPKELRKELRNRYHTKVAEEQLGDSTVYNEINQNKKILTQLVDSSNKYFKKFVSSGYISYKEMNYFTYEYKRACNLGKLYLLPKIYKRLFNEPGRPAISNCGKPTEKVSVFWTIILNLLCRRGYLI